MNHLFATLCLFIAPALVLVEGRTVLNVCEVSVNQANDYICCLKCDGCTEDTEPCTYEKRHLMVDRAFANLCPVIVQNDIYMCCDKFAEKGCKCPRHVTNGCNYKALYSRSELDLGLDLEQRSSRCAVVNYEGVFRCCAEKEGCKCPSGFKSCPSD